MKRDKLLKRLAMLPPDTDVLVKIGDGEVDIAEIVGLEDGVARRSVALLLHPGDLRDALTYRYTSG
jgi:hypothetical protein